MNVKTLEKRIVFQTESTDKLFTKYPWVRGDELSKRKVKHWNKMSGAFEQSHPHMGYYDELLKHCPYSREVKKG
jgi:hypothetical protein